MKELLEQGYGFIFTGFFVGIGILTRLVLWREYALLARACRNFGTARNKIIVRMREDLCRRAQKSMGIRSAAVYTECRLSESKVFGIRLGVWERITEQSVLLVMLCGVLETLAGVLWGCDVKTILFFLFLSGIGGLFLLMVDFVAGLREKRNRIRLHIRDYIENLWLYETEEQYFDRQEVPRIKGKKHCKAQEEKRRLTEELLRERRQMEARHIAERREREKEEELRAEGIAVEKVTAESETAESIIAESVMAVGIAEESENAEGVTAENPEDGAASVSVQQAQNEAAATEISYESLLREVLSEYLA